MPGTHLQLQQHQKTMASTEKQISELSDTIKAMNENIQEIMQNSVTKTDIKTIDTKISSIDNRIQAAISNASEALQTAKEAKSTAEETDANLKKVNDELTQVKNDRDLALNKLSNMNEKMNKLDAYIRRENLIFEGIQPRPNEDCGAILKEIFRDKLQIDNADAIHLQRVHRMPSSKKIKPIICRFLSFPDRQKVWGARRNLKGSNIFINEDLPIEYLQRRSKLYPALKKARELKKLAFFKDDMLYIEGTAYSVENANDLPEDLHLAKLASKSSDDMVAFFTSSCPLSNFYPTSFSIDGNKFSSTEQYLQWHKAHFAKKPDVMKQIMSAQTALEAKSLGDKIVLANEQWLPEAESALLHACTLKFEQDPIAKKFLLDTKKKQIIEASKNTIWGVGRTLSDKNIFTPDWEGDNLCGKILMKVRDQLN